MRPRLSFDFRYSFAVGRIRVLEKHFLTKQIFDRLLGSSSPQEMGRILSEGGYRSDFSGAGSWFDIENSLDHEWNDTLDLVSQLNRDPFWTDLFRKKIDYFNLKVFLKGKLSEKPRDDLFQEGGFVPVESLKQKAQSEQADELPPFFQDMLQKANEALAETSDPALVELVVDRFETEDWNLAFQHQPNRFLAEWLRRQIDLINLTTLLRIKFLKEESPYFDKAFLEGGTFACAFFLELIEEPWKSVYQALESTDYHSVVVRAVRDLEGGKGFSEWERLCQTMKWQYLQFARQFGFGVEVLFAFLLVKEMELSLVRRILVGRANGLAKDTIVNGAPHVII